MDDLLVCGLGAVYRYNAKQDAWRCVLDQERFYTFGVTWCDKYFWLGRADTDPKSQTLGAYLTKCDTNFQVIEE